MNVPLSRARTGSASTRTTHPHFLRLLGAAAAAHGVPNPLVNPYTFATKGEMLRDSRNLDLLRELTPMTVSAPTRRRPACSGEPRSTAATASHA